MTLVAPNAAGGRAPTGVNSPDPLAPKGTGSGKITDPIAVEVVARWNACADELMKQRRDYWQNLSMFFGEQWVWWDGRRNQLQALPQAWSPLGRGRARTVTNRIRPNIESLLGRMLRNDLEFDVPPTEGADDVMAGAMLAEDVLAAAHHDLDWRGVRFDENFAKFIGGTSAVLCEWDQKAGIPLQTVDRTRQVIGTGEIHLTGLSIQEFGLEPGVRDPRGARWFVTGLAYSPEAVKAMFDLDFLPAADASTLMSPLQQKLLEHMGRSQGTNRLTMVLTMYERPNSARPNGKYAVVVNGRKVYESDWPFTVRDRLNIFVFRQQKVSGTWIGTTLMNDAVPVQVAYNFMRSCIAEHSKKVGNARVMAPIGSMQEEDLSDDPGSILFFTPDLGGGVPQYMRPPDLPRWLVGEAGALKAELDDLMFVHDTSRGQASFDRASGQALALLAEKDDSPLGLMAFEESQRWAEIGSFVLKTYQSKVVETRVAQANPRVGRPGQTRIARWNGKSLRGQTRVIVPLETTLPVSEAAQQMFAKDMWDRGLIKDPMVFARLLRIPQRELLDVIDADVASAQRENALMALGEVVFAEKFEDHAKHIAEHNRWRKSDSYRYASKEIRSVVDDHIAMHTQLAAEQLGEQTRRAMASPALAALPQGDEPVGSQVPPDFAEQQAGMGMPAPGGAGAPAGAPAGGPAPQGGPAGAPQGGPVPMTPPGMAAGAGVPGG